MVASVGFWNSGTTTRPSDDDAPGAQRLVGLETPTSRPDAGDVDAGGGGGGKAEVRKDPFVTALDVCESMLRLIQQVEKARELRWERGIGVPPAFGMRDTRIRTIPM